MNDDLISRSALLEEINNFSMRITGSANAMALVIMDETKKSIMRMVEEQPVAYNMDKVVEQLEEKTEIAYNRYMDCGPNTPPSVYTRYGTQYNERKLCLEIVKSGGIE